jgi:exosortase
MNVATRRITAAASTQSPYLPLAIIGALFIAIYWSTFAFMMFRWRTDEAFQHGWLVIPVALWVVWAKRDKLKTLPVTSHKNGLWVMGFALLLHLFEKAVDLNGPSPISIPIFVAGAVLYFLGPVFLRELAFPIAYLIFMIPIPGGFTEIVSFPLRMLATNLSKEVAGWFGVQVYGSGMHIEFGQPRGTEWLQLEVADPCSGLHSIMAIKALHAIFAYTTQLRLGWKWFLFLCALPIALLSNLARIVGIILIGAYWSRDIAVGLFHTYSPFILYPVALLILISIGRLLEWLTVPRTTSPSS